MGAAASVQQIYREALLWYKKYFDEDMYAEDFASIDKDSDGAISYAELHKWIKKKAAEEKGAWKLLLSNEEVLRIAHDRCAKLAERAAGVPHMVARHKVVDIVEFKRVLIHLFAISTLWVHFKNADEWVNSLSFGDFELSRDEFKLACCTVSGSYAHDAMTEEQLEEAFALLDANKDGAVDFLEVCDYCCSFIDAAGYNAVMNSPPLRDMDGLDIPMVDEVGDDDSVVTTPQEIAAKASFRKELGAINSLKSAHKFHSTDQKNKMAVEAIAVHMEKNQKMADFMEVRFNTENEVMASLGTLAPM